MNITWRDYTDFLHVHFLLQYLKNEKRSYKSLKYSWKVKIYQVHNLYLVQMERFKYKIFKWFAWSDTCKPFRVMFQDLSQASISFRSLHLPWPIKQLCKQLNSTAYKSSRGCSVLSHHALQNHKHKVLFTLKILLIYLHYRKTTFSSWPHKIWTNRA